MEAAERRHCMNRFAHNAVVDGGRDRMDGDVPFMRRRRCWIARQGRPQRDEEVTERRVQFPAFGRASRRRMTYVPEV